MLRKIEAHPRSLYFYEPEEEKKEEEKKKTCRHARTHYLIDSLVLIILLLLLLLGLPVHLFFFCHINRLHKEVLVGVDAHVTSNVHSLARNVFRRQFWNVNKCSSGSCTIQRNVVCA